MFQNIEKNEIEEINAKLDQLLQEKGETKPAGGAKAASSGKPVVCIVGMGYVGFPLAAIAASKGYEVYGFDTDIERLKRIENGENIFNEKFLDAILPKVKIQTFHDPRLMRIMDIFIIAVPTPVDEKHNPILKHVTDASRTIAENMKPGSLVILESTVNPGVSEEVVKPIFEKAGYTVGKDVFISHSPERVDPGNEKWNVSNIPRVIGSFDEEGLRKTKEFYESIIDAEILPMDNIREAEAVKILENAFRDVNIAFVNEMAMSFARIGIDITNVLRGASTKPYWFMAHRPGCGVGGHCIPVDPYYMIEKGKENQFEHKFLTAARVINDGMADYTVELLQNKLNEIKKSVKGTKIGVLGISYKENVGDLRESPALRIIDKIKNLGADLLTFDPFVPQLSNTNSLEEILSKSEALVLVTMHNEFKNIPVEDFVKNGIKVIVDGRNCLDKKAIREAGIIYVGIGR
ncbi:MAG: nucleotide sugar dehydrogenase [Candidatus Moranbacteria bacterium]|nr:nucleotide sugar dehydrogenase [Candidatus Moranbacteria bacterium]